MVIGDPNEDIVLAVWLITLLFKQSFYDNYISEWFIDHANGLGRNVFVTEVQVWCTMHWAASIHFSSINFAKRLSLSADLFTWIIYLCFQQILLLKLQWCLCFHIVSLKVVTPVFCSGSYLDHNGYLFRKGKTIQSSHKHRFIRDDSNGRESDCITFILPARSCIKSHVDVTVLRFSCCVFSNLFVSSTSTFSCEARYLR